MNDRFKFRIWHKPSKQMYYNDFVICPTGYLVPMISQGDLDFDKQCKLMQSTGLKDKNGKLIYELDIVKSFHVSSTMQGRVFTGFVTYDDERCRYCISENKHCGYVTFSDTDDVFEVIGNIYENKDLLNENS